MGLWSQVGVPKSGVPGRVDQGESPTSREASPQPRPCPAPSPSPARQGDPPEKVGCPAPAHSRPRADPAFRGPRTWPAPLAPKCTQTRSGTLCGSSGHCPPALGRTKGAPTPAAARGGGRGLPSWGEEQRPPPYLGRESAGSGPGRGGGEGTLGRAPPPPRGCGDLSARCGSGASPPRHPGPRNPALGKGRLNRPSRTSGCGEGRGGRGSSTDAQRCLRWVLSYPVSVIVSVVSICFF